MYKSARELEITLMKMFERLQMRSVSNFKMALTFINNIL